MREWYGSNVKFYAEDNDISYQKAFNELHCQDEKPIPEINENGELEFDSITDYVDWLKWQRRKKKNDQNN